MKELLKKLCALDGVPGYEDEVREFIEKAVAPYATSMEVDPVGNLIVFKKGAKPRKRPLALFAHMDEVGFLVKDITEDGMLKLAPAGGIDPRVLIGRRMRVGEKKIPGIISLKAIHLTTPEERKEAPGIGSLYTTAISVRDYNFFMALTFFYTLINLLSGLVIDLSYGFIDPRIKMGEK